MRYEKYLGCEFSYYDNILNKYIHLILTDIKKRENNNYYAECSHCMKPLKNLIYFFTRTDSEENEEYLFGSECVKNVFGAGLVK